MTDSARSGRRGCGRSAGRRVPAVAGDARQADPAQDQRKRSLLGVCRGGFRFHPPQACPVCRPTTSWPSYAEGRGDQQVISWIPQIYSKFGGRRERRRRDLLPNISSSRLGFCQWVLSQTSHSASCNNSHHTRRIPLRTTTWRAQRTAC